MKARALPFAVITCLVASTMARGDAASDAMKALQGTWHLTSCEKEGKKLPADQIKNVKIVLTDGKYQFAEGKGADDDTKGTFKIDASKKPLTIEATPDDGSAKGKSIKGIYELKGDTFTVCFSKPGSAKAPTEFKSKAGAMLQTWTRVKK